MTPQEQHVFNLVKSELKPEMVPPEYRGKVASKFCGHCHHATLAMYELLGGKTPATKYARQSMNFKSNTRCETLETMR